MEFTVHLINNHTDGWYDDILPDAQLEISMTNSACDPAVAVTGYLEIMKEIRNPSPSAIFGCRCSGASMSVASIASAENVAMLSPESTSTKLSNKDEYSTFSRIIAPDDRTGQVGALMQLLKTFGWHRVSILNTDTQFTQDIALELQEAWTAKNGWYDGFIGDVGHTDTIKLNNTSGEVDLESVRTVLDAFPVDDPSVNSRVIVLFAHHQHAFPILETATQMGFQPDAIWVGTSEWISREPINGDNSWMPPVPGYLGVIPYRNRTALQYIDFLQRLQQYERQNNMPVTKDLLDFVEFLVPDGVLALAKAFDAVPEGGRLDGELISQKLRQLEFEGISGPIRFDAQGNLRNPVFTIASRDSSAKWSDVGVVTPNSSDINIEEICFAVVGCGNGIPDDKYPPNRTLLPIWIWVVVASLVLSLVLFYYQRWKHQTVADKLMQIEEQLKSLESDDDAVKRKKGKLYKEIAGLLGQPAPEHWTGEQQGLVEVAPSQQEYWDVLTKLRATMNEGETCHLSKLSRVQNFGIWSYYVFRKNQLANKYGTDLTDTKLVKEKYVWHGTSSLNPDVIWNDQQDGFMMQLSQQGQWGRGIYFSERSGFCDPYSFKPYTEHSGSSQGDRELFLVKLLVGEAIFLDRNEGQWMEEACKLLLAPPDNPMRDGLKFDTVEGEVDDEAKTKIYVVYENGRAYPEYLCRYYKGDRDKSRTPYESLEEALVAKSLHDEEVEETKENISGSTAPAEDDANSVASTISVQAVWQFLNDNAEWENHLNGHQVQLEQAYRNDPNGIVTIEHFPFTYVIDFNVNLQTNLDHPDMKSRKVRRIHMGSSPV